MENTTSPVLVTGGTGYLASHIILELLKRKYYIRTSVRSLKDTNKYSYLFSLTPDAKKYLTIVEADLLNPNGWDEAVKGCDAVFHVASPFPINLPKDENEVIKPAVDGTLNVLNACLKNNVRKVVLTSSIAAIMQGNQNLVCTEDDWSSARECPPYEKSKLLAEEAAWKFYNQNKDKIEFTVLCPGLLWGPILNKNTFTSGELVSIIMRGEVPAIPNFMFPIADVRDCAIAHINALERNGTNGRRYLIVSECVNVEQIVKTLKQEFGKFGYKFPRFKVGKLLVHVAALYNPVFKLFLADLGHHYEFSNKRSMDELGIKYTPVAQSLVELVHSMLDKGMLPDKRKPSPKL